MIAAKTAKEMSGHLDGHGARVSNVIRYTCGEYFRKNNPERWEELHPTVKRRGWFYVVLVEGD